MPAIEGAQPLGHALPCSIVGRLTWEPVYQTRENVPFIQSFDDPELGAPQRRGEVPRSPGDWWLQEFLACLAAVAFGTSVSRRARSRLSE
jgi:hypothetical protein